MKSYKSVFICSFSILLGLVIVVNVNAQDPRRTLWLGGGMPTSIQFWYPAQTDLSSNLYNYQFEDIIVYPSNNGDPGYDPDLGVINAAHNLTPLLENESDVLGIAHDYGGMILRELSNQSPNLSGMILSGVPNQGSVAIQSMLSNPGGSADSQAEVVISAFEDIINPEKCQDCNLYGAFSDWIRAIESNDDDYRDIEKGASVVNHLNDHMPAIPYAVLYGTVENFSIAQFMDDYSFLGQEVNGYEKCYLRELQKLEARIKSAQIKREIRLIKAKPQSLFMQILGIIGGAVAQPNGENENGFDFSVFGQNFTLLPTPSSIVSIVNALIEHQTNNQIYSLESQIAEIEAELEAIQLMICSTAQDFIEAQWELLVLQASGFEIEEVENTYFSTAEFDFCVDQCEVDLYFGDIPEDTDCDTYCGDIEPTEVTEINIIIHHEGHDGLLTESEQQLEGENLANNYHLANTNHFFEQSMNNPDFAQAITDLFDGNAGMVFFVPKD
jgi:hypothetical protein